MIKIAICDDVAEYRLSIKAYVNEYLKIHHNTDALIYEFNDGKSLLNFKEGLNILFLDIELGDANGIEIAKIIQKRNPDTVILIVTSYHQYLDDAMDIDVARYIDKPVTQSRIYSAMDKALSVINETVITIHLKDNRIIRLKQSVVVYAEAKLKGVYVYCRDSKSYRIRENMKQLRAMLNASCFATPHNSYIVNLNYVRDFSREEIFLSEPYFYQGILVATRKQPEFKRKFLDFIGEDMKND